MALLASHLEQISLSAKSIASLEFPPPKIFTNALLNNHEITTLIRDTEPHERALFSIDPNVIKRTRPENTLPPKSRENGASSRKSLFPAPQAHPMKQSAISRLLGREMLSEIRKSSSSNARTGDGVNVEILLRGAQRLCDVYAVAGAPDKIQALRNRHREVAASIADLQDKVSKQQSVLDRRNVAMASEDGRQDDPTHDDMTTYTHPTTLTEEDFRGEEEEIRELEARKKALEERVSGMERDLGGLLT